MELSKGYIKIITITPIKTPQANVENLKDLSSEISNII